MSNDVKNTTLTFLKTKFIGVLATINTEGNPQAATIYYSIDDDFTIYFVTRKETRKYQNLKYNQKIALVVGTDNIPMTIQIEGVASEILDEVEKATIQARLSRVSATGKYPPPINKYGTGSLVFFKIKPTMIRLLDQTGVSSDQNGPIQII